ncbi:ABC transporter F family member 1, partial [Tanacetum coccineum]
TKKRCLNVNLIQAQSKEKTLAKMERGGLTEKVTRDSVLVFRFVDVGKLPPPVLQFSEVKFGYTPDNLIYKCLDFGVDLDSRVALVGPNGAGKSTLLKLMTGELTLLKGMEYPRNVEEKLRVYCSLVDPGKPIDAYVKNCSDGQKSRVVFAWFAFRPTQMRCWTSRITHLDIETIDR